MIQGRLARNTADVIKTGQGCIDHMLGHKTILMKFKKTEIIPSTCHDHKCIKLEVNNKRKTGKSQTH